MADKICKICKLVFKVKLSHFNKRVCCSRLCLKEHYKISLLGNKNPNWRGGISVAESKCNYCGIDFKSTNYKPNYYCSRICQNRKQANDKKQQALERNKEKKPKIKKPFELKKYYCVLCTTSQVQTKGKTCSDCRYKKYHRELTCKLCGEKSIVKKSAFNKVFCNRSCALQSHKGSNNKNYKGGITPENKKIRASLEYKAWRISVFTRDKYTCVSCGKIGHTLHADHIKPFAFYPESRLDINNGRTLCKLCHKKTDSYLKGNKNTYKEKGINNAGGIGVVVRCLEDLETLTKNK